MDFFVLWLIPALLVGLLGLMMVLASTRHIRRCEEVAGWAKTNGMVEKSDVECLRTRRVSPNLRTAYRTMRYVPRIEYVYQLNGVTYRSHGYQNFNGIYVSNTEAQAAQIAASYPVGRKVEVTCNPDNPAQAYLLPATDASRLVKQRRVQAGVLVVAFVWLAIGSMIQLTGQAAANKATQQLKASSGLVPVSADILQKNLDQLAIDLQFTCSQEPQAGNQFVYSAKTCAGDGKTRIEAYSRKDDPQKVDLVSAFVETTSQEDALAFLQQAAALPFSGADATNLHEWLAASLGQALQSGGHADTKIGGAPVTLDNLGETLRLNIGTMQ